MDFDSLEKKIVARAGGLSQAALIAEELHVLPAFIGNRGPVADPAARGAVVGLDLREDAASLEELYVAGPVRPRLRHRRDRSARLNARATNSRLSSSQAAPRGAGSCARSSPTHAARRSERRRRRNQCSWVRR